MIFKIYTYLNNDSTTLDYIKSLNFKRILTMSTAMHLLMLLMFIAPSLTIVKLLALILMIIILSLPYIDDRMKNCKY